MIRYWSETEERVSVRHLQSFFIGHAKAEDLHQHLLQALKDANLDLRQVLMLGSDGPNVNKKVWRLFDSEVRTVRSDRGLADIGTCNIHIVHNAFLKGLDHHGSKVSDFAIRIFYFFSGWPARLEDFGTIQENLKLPPHRFLKHVPSRWLTLVVSAERLDEQWDALDEYFLAFTPKKRPELTKFSRY